MIYLEHQKTSGLAIEHLMRDWGLVVERAASPSELLEKVEEAQLHQAGYALALVGITRHLLHSSQYCGLLRELEVERDCRTLLLTPTLETHDDPLSSLASGHITKPVCRDTLYDELLLLIHGIMRGAPAKGAGPQGANLGAGAPRVLAVDDNEANLKLVLTLLRDQQIQAEGAASGFEALSKARQSHFDLVFMDLQMPGMDGVETTERLRNLDGYSRKLPIIALTAHALADERERLTQQGFDGYLAKPISSQQLMDTIRDHTGYTDTTRTAGAIQEVRDTRGGIRPSTRKQQLECVNIPESLQLAAGKTDLAEELFSMLLEQLQSDLPRLRSLWDRSDMDSILECVHKLHGAARYCGVPELREAANQFETGLKQSSPNLELFKDQLLAAMERLEIWGEQSDWQAQFRAYQSQAYLS